jgi:hypothetical protein
VDFVPEVLRRWRSILDPDGRIMFTIKAKVRLSTRAVIDHFHNLGPTPFTIDSIPCDTVKKVYEDFARRTSIGKVRNMMKGAAVLVDTDFPNNVRNACQSIKNRMRQFHVRQHAFEDIWQNQIKEEFNVRQIRHYDQPWNFDTI